MKGKTKYVMPIKVREVPEGASAPPDDECHLEMVISTGDRDRHFSYMTDKTLRNYGDDCVNGNVPFINAHQTHSGLEKQIGVIFDGKYDETTKRTSAAVKVLRDTEDTPDEFKVGEVLRRVERGLYDKVSVGFFGGEEICDLCDKPIWDLNDRNGCKHIPGRRAADYDNKVCTYKVHDAHLNEVSLVPNGSNPNARITNMRDWDPELLEAKKINQRALSVEEKDGKLWREGLIDDCIKEGVRSDPSFDDGMWRQRLAGWDAKAIQDQTLIFTKLGDERFGKGGPETTDGRSGGQQTSEPVLILPVHW